MRIVAGAVLIAGAFAGWYSLAMERQRSAAEQARVFDVLAWKAGSGELDYSARGPMIEDAAAQTSLGMTDAEVVSLLGPPDRQTDTAMIWHAGRGGVGLLFLHVSFADGLVSGARVIRD